MGAYRNNIIDGRHYKNENAKCQNPNIKWWMRYAQSLIGPYWLNAIALLTLLLVIAKHPFLNNIL
jgi:hypothetical protein